MSQDRRDTSRRTFIKGAGAASIGIATALSGCTGGPLGGGGQQSPEDGGDGDGGGNGEDGDGGGGPQTTDEPQLQEVNITLAPSGFQGLMMDHIVDNSDILATKMEERGYTANVQKTWEGAALFAAGGPDFSTISSFEASRLGVERDLDLAVIARVAPLFMGWWTKKGGPFDPARTGSEQATFDKLVNDQATTAIGSWAGGDVPGYTISIDTLYGYHFGQENNDFKTVTADYFAIPQLIMDEDVAAGGTSPVHGVARHLDEEGNPQHVELFQCAAGLKEAGIGVPPLNSLTTTQSFLEDNRGAAEAYVQAWHRGMQWLSEDPMGRIMENQEKHFQQLGVTSEAQAQYIVDWGVNLTLDNEFPYNYIDIELTEEAIEEDKNFLSTAAERGFIPSEWDQRVEFVNIPQK